jgi:NOL1/NOP2/fmu family ribosome biogenesis protein
VVELDRSQTENFLRGRSVSAGFEQTRALSHHGFVVVRHQGFCIGSADVELLEREIKVMSLFPKAWRRDALLKD